MTLDQQPIETQSNSITDKLASLDAEFNPNKEFGMMGVLRAQQELQQAEAAPAPAVVETEAKPSEPPDWAQALESSFRATRNDLDQKLSALETRFAQPPQGAQFGQEAGEDVDPVVARQNQLEAQLAQTRMNTAWERANGALMRAKQKFEGFNYTDAELQAIWRQNIGNNVQMAENTNWDVYFQQQYDSRRRPELEAEIAKLKAQGSKSDVVNNMGAVPRGGRNGAPQVARSNDDGFDEDLYQRASKRMGKHGFRGFNNVLVEEQNRKMLRTG